MAKKSKAEKQLLEDIAFKREMLSKHSQLMRMYLSLNSMERAEEHFEVVEHLFNYLSGKGEYVYFYTAEDFENDCKQFKKMKR